MSIKDIFKSKNWKAVFPQAVGVGLGASGASLISVAISRGVENKSTNVKITAFTLSAASFFLAGYAISAYSTRKLLWAEFDMMLAEEVASTKAFYRILKKEGFKTPEKVAEKVLREEAAQLTEPYSPDEEDEEDEEDEDFVDGEIIYLDDDPYVEEDEVEEEEGGWVRTHKKDDPNFRFSIYDDVDEEPKQKPVKLRKFRSEE